MNTVLMMSLLFACGEEAPKTETKAPEKVEAKEAAPKVEAKKEETQAEAAPKEEAPKAEEKTAEPVATARTGEQVFTQVCVSCHQVTGLGLPSVYPPLAGSDWMAKSNDTLIKIVLHGLMGEIEVNGAKYNNVMTPWGGSLNDEEVANVLTYVRTSWGNTGDAVTAEEVATVRAANQGHAPWNASELK